MSRVGAWLGWTPPGIVVASIPSAPLGVPRTQYWSVEVWPGQLPACAGHPVWALWPPASCPWPSLSLPETPQLLPSSREHTQRLTHWFTLCPFTSLRPQKFWG